MQKPSMPRRPKPSLAQAKALLKNSCAIWLAAVAGGAGLTVVPPISNAGRGVRCDTAPYVRLFDSIKAVLLENWMLAAALTPPKSIQNRPLSMMPARRRRCVRTARGFKGKQLWRICEKYAQRYSSRRPLRAFMPQARTPCSGSKTRADDTGIPRKFDTDVLRRQSSADGFCAGSLRGGRKKIKQKLRAG